MHSHELDVTFFYFAYVFSSLILSILRFFCINLNYFFLVFASTPMPFTLMCGCLSCYLYVEFIIFRGNNIEVVKSRLNRTGRRCARTQRKSPSNGSTKMSLDAMKPTTTTTTTKFRKKWKTTNKDNKKQ